MLECIPAAVAQTITAELSIPTIGIGAGPHCDGQVLVTPDLVGLTPQNQTPRFVKAYSQLRATVTTAVQQYIAEVRDGSYPDESHTPK